MTIPGALFYIDLSFFSQKKLDFSENEVLLVCLFLSNIEEKTLSLFAIRLKQE